MSGVTGVIVKTKFSYYKMCWGVNFKKDKQLIRISLFKYKISILSSLSKLVTVCSIFFK